LVTTLYEFIHPTPLVPSAPETAKEHSKSNLKKVGKKAYQLHKNHQIKTQKTV